MQMAYTVLRVRGQMDMTDETEKEASPSGTMLVAAVGRDSKKTVRLDNIAVNVFPSEAQEMKERLFRHVLAQANRYARHRCEGR